MLAMKLGLKCKYEWKSKLKEQKRGKVTKGEKKRKQNEEKSPDSGVYRLDQLSVFVRVGHSLWVIIHLIT